MKRDTGWQDGATRPDLAWFLVSVKVAGLARCVLCDSPQPDDVTWMHYCFDLRAKFDGEFQRFEYKACPSCKPDVDKLIDWIGSAVLGERGE